jgi:uncharacterized protein with PQ loop repeat
VIVCARNSPFQPPGDYAKIVLAGKIALLTATLCAVVSVWLFTNSKRHVESWAHFLGIVSAMLAVVQYLPQLWTTFHLKHTGSLSIPMMCIQSPGGMIWSASLAVRPGTKWTSWAGYLVAALLQFTLLIMAVYFETRRKHEIADIITGPLEADEQTPLVD